MFRSLRPWQRLALMAIVLSSLVVAFSYSSNQLGIAQSQRQEDYMPWGVDEFELFGLTKFEIQSRFKDKAVLLDDGRQLSFDNPITCSTARFLLQYENGKVCGVQRQFTAQSAGYTAKGPLLRSKEVALRYVIDSLSKSSNIDRPTSEHLNRAKQLLAKLVSNTQTPPKSKSVLKESPAKPANHIDARN